MLRRAFAVLAGLTPLIAVLLMSFEPSPRVFEPAEARPLPSAVDWVAVVGGPEPSFNQVSLAQDLVGLEKALGPRGYVLFGGGPGAPVLVSAPPAEDLRASLAQFFDPRDRATAFLPGPHDVDGPASLDTTLDVLEAAVQRRGALLLYIAGHGDAGDEPAQSVVRLWGGWALDVPTLADVVQRGERRVRVVDTTCFGGGFADIVFAGADPGAGPSDAVHCGFFAALWDEEASGCDPNPDRRRQDSYSIHFFEALLGRDRAGRPARIDLDGDGEVSLLEAHTQVRVASRSIDVPNTTSERWLRHRVDALVDEGVVAEEPDLAPFEIVEEDRVIEELGVRLGVTDRDAANERQTSLELALQNEEVAIEDAQATADNAYYALRIRLLERWPTLDDPWRSETTSLLERDAARIADVFERSAEAAAYRDAQGRLDEALARIDDARVELAQYRRLTRAWDTRALAALLRQYGGADWERYELLLQCERGLPIPDDR